MKITHAHLLFYWYHKHKLTGALALVAAKQVPGIDSLVPGGRGSADCGKHNTVTLLRMARKREPSWSSTLAKFVESREGRRAADCRKWLARIQKDKQ